MPFSPSRLIAAALSAVLLSGVLAVPAFAEDTRHADTLDPTVASVDISERTFLDPRASGAVVLGRNDGFADNLGGSALAGMVGGPLLLTDGGPDAPIRSEVLDEITRLNSGFSADCDAIATADVYILGGPNAVSTEVEDLLTSRDLCVKRLFGPSRVETSVAVAKEMRSLGNGFSGLSVARADNFADSAAAGALGALTGAPIVLTPGDVLHPAVEQLVFGDGENEGLAEEDYIQILGGTAAISQEIEQQLYFGPDRSWRVAGATRDDTAAQLAGHFQFSQDDEFTDSVALVNGFMDDGWVYALIAGAVAPITGAPVVYVQTDAVGDPLAQYLRTYRPSTIISVGPETRISDMAAAEARTIVDSSS